METADKTKTNLGRRQGMGVAEARTKRQHELYTDPDYLPHIPHGDLAHLSDAANTGAARQGLHEVWRWPLLTS